MVSYTNAVLLFCLFWQGGSAILAQDIEIEPLEEALWEGRLVIHVTGPLHSQTLGNKLDERGSPVGFIKEKGKMKLDYKVEFRFMVNALGEHTMSARERFEGEKVLDREYWYMFDEEYHVKKTRVSTKRRVRVSENSEYTYLFDVENTYNDTNFEIGNFRVQPTGRMDKKGVIKVIGELNPTFKGEGKAVFTNQRQPAGDYSVKTSEANAVTYYELPLSFEVVIPHKTDEVSTPVQVKVQPTVPFYFPDAPEKAPDIFKHTVEATGTVTLKPLFETGRKKRKRK